MLKAVNIRLYEVRRGKGNHISFEDALGQIAETKLGDREEAYDEDLTIRLEKLGKGGGIVYGEIVRLQGNDLPGKASRGRALEKLGIDSIGHSTVFAYSAVSSTIAFQIARNGITAPLLGHYVGEQVGASAYRLLPVPNDEMWERLRKGRVRSLRFRVSSPGDLESIDAETGSIRHALREMKETLKTAHIEITVSMRRGDPDVSRTRTEKIARWLLRELNDDRGGVSRIGARIIDEGEDEAKLLNLISAHKGETAELDLPADDPDKSCDKRGGVGNLWLLSRSISFVCPF